MLIKVELEDRLHGVFICRSAPSVSHLLFVDDSLILCKATREEAEVLKYILSVCEECSGQMINNDKSAVMFSPNTSREDRQGVMSVLNINNETSNERCLGLPVYVGRSRTNVFSYLKERIWQRVQDWKEKLLSKAGKEVLIKAVAQAIPVFAMGCFDITKEMCNQISSMIAKFWWNTQDKDNSMLWLSWEKLVSPRAEGGLGFRDLHSFNMAMLAKPGWRLIHNPGSLCARILKAKYYPTSSLLETKTKMGCSYT